MPGAAVLFNVQTFPRHDVPVAPDAETATGLAEWFGSVPPLFLLLIGGDATPASFGAFSEIEAPIVLAAPMADVRTRWQRVRAVLGDDPAVAGIDAALADAPFDWLVLDAVDLYEGEPGDAGHAAHLAGLRERAGALAAALDRGEDMPDLRDQPRGWWSPAVRARLAAVEWQDPEDRAAVIAELDDEGWIDGVQAYQVRRPGQPDSPVAHLRPLGLVTPYGRWLLPLSAGVHGVIADDDAQWLLAFRDEGETRLSGLLDANGRWRYPLGSFALGQVLSPTRFVMHDTEDGPGRIVRLPDGATLFEGVRRAESGDDGLLRITGQDGLVTVVDQDGATLLPPRYAEVGTFHKQRRWAVVRSADGKEGLLRRDGTEIIACRHGMIARHGRDAAPKLYRRDRLIGVDYGPMRFTLYAPTGKVVAGPFDFGSMDGLPIIEEDRLLVLDGQGREAHVGWIDFDGKPLAHTGETWGAWLRQRWSAGGEDAPDADIADGEAWLRTVCALLTLGDAHAATRMAGDLLADEDVTLDAPAEALIAAVDRAPHSVRVDWKDSGPLVGLAASVAAPDGVLDGFDWDPRDNGESIPEGIAAARRHLAGSGLALFELDTLGDNYTLGLIRASDADAFEAACAQAGLRARTAN